jgi:SAM-dependent methyltransferase
MSPQPATAVNHLTDAEFDALLPAWAGAPVGVYWTSVVVARRVARMLAHLGVRRVLDVGSGAGKFCLAAAAKAPGIEFVGVEHRADLVRAAQELASQLGISNAHFSHGDATQTSWADFDAFYVFNAFAENDFPLEDRFDAAVAMSHDKRVADVKRVAHLLAARPAGCFVVTYHGLSGPIPGSYDLRHAEAIGSGWLRVWQKGTTEAEGSVWLEEGAKVSKWSAPAGTLNPTDVK